MSGRALRRLPVLALARYIGTGTLSTSAAVSASGSAINTPTKRAVNGNGTRPSNGHGDGGGANVAVWLEGMEKVIREQATEHEKLL